MKEIFSLFTSNDPYKPDMATPFLIDDKVYATDGYVLIRANKEYCDFEVTTNDKAPRCENIIPVQNKNLVLNLDKEIFEQCKTEDEVIYTGEDLDCNTCNGEGYVEWEFENYTKDDDCPVCHGSGFGATKKEVKSGKKTFGSQGIKLNNSYFKALKLYKLIEVQEKIGGEITLTHQSEPHKPCVFKIGNCEILIMPYLHDPEYHTELIIEIKAN